MISQVSYELIYMLHKTPFTMKLHFHLQGAEKKNIINHLLILLIEHIISLSNAKI